MSWLEHSKKMGRISALIIILAIAGTLSILEATKHPDSIKDMVHEWLLVLGPRMAW